MNALLDHLRRTPAPDNRNGLEHLYASWHDQPPETAARVAYDSIRNLGRAVGLIGDKPAQPQGPGRYKLDDLLLSTPDLSQENAHAITRGINIEASTGSSSPDQTT